MSKFTSNSQQCYTPSWLVEKARYVLGSIDTDPVSCMTAQATINAGLWFGPDKELQEARYDNHFPSKWGGPDGLNMTKWSGNVFINPPGGLRGRLVREFWERAVHYNGAVFWVGFNASQLSTLQRCGWCPTDYPTFLLRNRIKFDNAGRSPVHHNYVTLLHGSEEQNDRFTEQFTDLGKQIGVR